MATFTTTRPRLTSIVAHPAKAAGEHARRGRDSAARALGFPADPALDLRYQGGRTIEHLTFTNVYVGGAGAWDPEDVQRIDAALAAAMTDPHLNNVLAQYYADGRATSAFVPSRYLDGPAPERVYRDTVEHLAAGLERHGILSGLDLASTVVNLLLPRGTVLVDGTSTGGERRDEDDDAPAANPALSERDEAVDSLHGLGGYHGSIHPKHGHAQETLYYAVGVYSEGENGIVAFDEPWKNVCATFYHELCEARTDPDVEDAIRAGNDPEAVRFLGWYSARGGEIGDIPMEEAGANLGLVMKEVPVRAAPHVVPIQLQWSNAVAGPEGPIAHKHPPAARG